MLDRRLCIQISGPSAPRKLAQSFVARDLPDPTTLSAALALMVTATPGAQQRILGCLLGILL
jgi:hypothetical protein